MQAELPEKLFYKIGEVATITSLRTSVLRFWETEFSCLSPRKSASGQRLYSQKDLNLISEIKNLLYSEKLTIEGARKKLAARSSKRTLQKKLAALSHETLIDILSEVKEELQHVRDSL